jgi:class 3 adenylate cyclase
MFPVLMIEIVLCYKLSNPRLEQIYFWTGCFHVYSLLVLGVLLSLQVKYLGKWTQAGFNELQIQLTITLIFFMRNILLRHFIITYTIYMVCWIVTVTFLSTKFEYQIFQFIIGQIMYAILLCIGIHHREMIQRKSINYERILNVEINKTNELISKLLPHHMLNVIKSEKRQVDEFDDDMTLLYTDIIGANSFNKVNKDSREIVVFIQKVFARFDQLCEENRVYKVHTVGNKYVIMGYNGRVEKFQRNMAVVVDEANRVIQTGFEMLDIIKEVREQSTIPSAKDLTLRIGIHTGKVYAGIIGSKQVRYDIFGEGVLTSNKIE